MRRLSARLATVVTALLAACNGEPGATTEATDIPALAELPCESARVLKLRTVARAEGLIGGPISATDNGVTRAPDAISSAIHYVSLECGGQVYVARLLGRTPDFRPEKLGMSVTVRRTDGGKFLLKSEHGVEFEAILAAAPPPDATPPK
jgi:hypothetical protein